MFKGLRWHIDRKFLRVISYFHDSLCIFHESVLLFTICLLHGCSRRGSRIASKANYKKGPITADFRSRSGVIKNRAAENSRQPRWDYLSLTIVFYFQIHVVVLGRNYSIFVGEKFLEGTIKISSGNTFHSKNIIHSVSQNDDGLLCAKDKKLVLPGISLSLARFSHWRRRLQASSRDCK